MTHTVIIRGDVQRALAKRLIDRVPLGYVVTIKEQTRTGEQNNRMWAMLSDIARVDPLGRKYNADAYKVVAMAANNHKPEYIIGTEGEIIPIGFKSSRLTVPQMSELIEWLFWYGAQHDIKWSNEAQEAAA